jgi:NitT/TauT family transport system substrate-binding protein
MSGQIKWHNVLILSLCIAGACAGGYLLVKHLRPKPEPPDRPLRVGVVTWPGYAGGIVANNGFKPNPDSIYQRRYKLPVEFILMEDVEARAKAFARGGADGLDIVWSTVDFWANELPGFLKNDVKARAIMQVDWSRGGDAIVADNSIKKIEDLRGQRISLTLFTPSHWLLEYNIRNSGLSPEEQAEIVKNIVGKNASPEARDDFIAGKVNAAVVWEPDVTDAIQKRANSHVLLSSKTASKLIADLMVVREDFLQQHPDVVKAFVQGWLDGTEEAYRHPETAVKVLMENEPLYQELGERVTREQLSTVHWATLADNVEMFDLDNQDRSSGRKVLFDEIFDQAGQAWVQRGFISQPLSASLANDSTILKQIWEAGNPRVSRSEEIIPAAPKDLCTLQGVVTKQVSINFRMGKAELNDAAREVIQAQISQQPRELANAYFCLEGNTDKIGDHGQNIRLSEERAKNVRRELINRFNLQETRFVAVGHGPDNPVCQEDTPECLARNRRTDVKVIPIEQARARL